MPRGYGFRSHGKLYTDGSKQIRLLVGETIPEGFRPCKSMDSNKKDDVLHTWCLYEGKLQTYNALHNRTKLSNAELNKLVILDDRQLDDPTFIPPFEINEELLQEYLESKS
jgi:hypothetical protein